MNANLTVHARAYGPIAVKALSDASFMVVKFS